MVEQGPSTAVKIGAAITAGALVAGGGAVLAYESGIFDSGASSHTQTIPTPEQPTIIPGTSVIRTATPEATAIPTPKSGFIENAGAFTYRTESGEVLSVPQIDGLIAKLVKVGDTNEVQYFAKEGNPYGVEVNKSVGEYKPNVDIYENSQRKELGGVSLVPQVVQKLLNNAIAEIPEQRNKWIVVPPVDINAVVESRILLSFTPNINTKKDTLEVRFTDKVLPLLNIIPGNPNIKTLKSPVYKWAYLDNIINIAPNNVTIIPGTEMSYLVVGGNFTNANDQLVSKKAFGERITEVEDKVYVGYGNPGGARDIDKDKILTVGNKIPVFIQSSDK